MSKQNSFTATAEAFAESLAALIEHPDCPPSVYKSFTEFLLEFQNDLTPGWTPQDEAASIRRSLPYLLSIAAVREVKQ